MPLLIKHVCFCLISSLMYVYVSTVCLLHGHVYSPQPYLVCANAKCPLPSSTACSIPLLTKHVRLWLISSLLYVHVLTICLPYDHVYSPQPCLVCAHAKCPLSASTACFILLLTKRVRLWPISSLMYVHVSTICLSHGHVYSLRPCLVCDNDKTPSPSSVACAIPLLTKRVRF